MKHQLHLCIVNLTKMRIFLITFIIAIETLRVVIDESNNDCLLFWEKWKKTEMHAEILCIHAFRSYCLYGNSSQIWRFNAVQPKSGNFIEVDKLILNDSMKCKRPRITSSEKEKKNTPHLKYILYTITRLTVLNYNNQYSKKTNRSMEQNKVRNSPWHISEIDFQQLC